MSPHSPLALLFASNFENSLNAFLFIYNKELRLMIKFFLETRVAQPTSNPKDNKIK